VPTLAEIMTKDPFVVGGDSTVADVAAQMVKQRVGSAERQGSGLIQVVSVAAREAHDFETSFEPRQRTLRDVAEACDQQALHAAILATQAAASSPR